MLVVICLRVGAKGRGFVFWGGGFEIGFKYAAFSFSFVLLCVGGADEMCGALAGER